MKRILLSVIVSIVLLAAVFTGCSGADKTVSTVKATEAQYTDEKGVGYNESADGKLYVSSFSNNASKLKIPPQVKGKKVTEIGRSSLKMNKLKSLELPDTIEKIDDYAFAFSRTLESVNIPDSVREIGTNAFAGCVKLKEIKLPKNLETIGMFSFDATALKTISIPKSVKEIKEYAFAECKSLNNITFNSKNTKIADTVFNNSPKVKITAPKNSTAVKLAKSKGIDYKIK